MNSQVDRTVVSSMQKNQHAEFRFGFSNVQGRQMASIWTRQLFQDDHRSFGLNIRLRQLDEFITHLTALRAAALEKGLLEV